MFFAFASDYQYDEKDWPWVWELELGIQAIILTSKEDGEDMDEEQIRMYLRFLSSAPTWPDEAVEEYLDREMEHIQDYIQTHVLPSDSLSPHELGLLPLPQLAQSLRASKSFRKHIEESVKRCE